MTNETGRLIRALIVGDSHITRSGVRRILESQSNMLVLGETKIANLKELDTFRGQRPDIILVDLDSYGHDALAWLSKIKKQLLGTVVLVIGDLVDDRRARKLSDLGAIVVLKMQPPSVLIATIESLCDGRGEHTELRKVEPDGRLTFGSRNAEGQKFYNTKIQILTQRERDIIAHIADGLKNKEIAEHLHISDITVRHHLTNIFMKLEVTNRQKLLILAHQHGLARPVLKPKAS